MNTLEFRRNFPVSRETLFAAWTQRAVLETWMCKDIPSQNPKYVELDVWPGGSYVIEIAIPEGGIYRGFGTFREVAPPARLVFSWAWERIPDNPAEPLQRHDSVITVELLDRDAGSEMHFSQEGLENEAALESHRQGWSGCFDVLARILG